MTEGIGEKLLNDPTRKPIKIGGGVDRVWGYKSRRELAKEVVIDGLTGLLNQKGWAQKCAEYSSHVARTVEQFTYVSCDLDQLKEINDSFGHGRGDNLIKNFAKVFKETGRSTDILARTGGDEFAALLPATSVEDAKVFVNRLNGKALAANIKVSIGIGKTFNEADKEMYRMKAVNKNV